MATIQVAQLLATSAVPPVTAASPTATIQVSALSASSSSATAPTIQVSALSAQTQTSVVPTIQVAQLSLSVPATITLPATASAKGGALVTLKATAPSATSWEWSQVSGPTVAFSSNGSTVTFTPPRLTTASQVVMQARALIGGAWSAWAECTVSVAKHPRWYKQGSTLVALKNASSPGGGGSNPTDPGVDITTVPCYGDSMVAGYGIGAANSWPAKLNGLLPAASTTANFGVSSQTAQEIAMRQGGMPINLVFPSSTIPASGAVTVTTPDTVVWGSVAWTVTGTVGGIAGTLSHPAGQAGTNTAVLTFTRTTAGAATTVTTPVSFRSSAGDRDKVQVFLAGRNDYGVGSNDTTIRNRVVNANKAMVDYLTGGDFVVLSNINLTSETTGTRGYNNVVAVNNSLSAMYGANFLDIRSWLVHQAIYDLGITPTAADLTAIAGDAPPPSVMHDNIHWNAAAAALVAQKVYDKFRALNYIPGAGVTPTEGLFFKLPDMGTSTKKVFAHYFGPYPRSINNSMTLAADTYTTVYNSPTGSFSQYGGFFRDRPIFRPQLTGDFKYQDCVWDLQQAKAAGIDGFFCDLLGLSGSNYDNYEKLKAAAHALDNGVKVIPMVDGNGATAAATPAQAAAYVASFAGLKCSYYLPDGRFVVSCFKAESKPYSWWEQMLAALQTTHGITPAFIGVYNNFNQSSTYAGISYGSSAWGYGADPSVIRAASDLSTVARGRGEKWMAPVVPQDQRPQNSLFDEALNTECLRASWEKAIAQNADLVQMVTWSDFSETAMAPSAANGWVHLDLSSWYITRWKTGSYPTILRDAVYLSHRSHTLIATVTGPQTKFMAHWQRGNMSAVRNDVESLTFLTASAEVTVTVGPNTYTYTAPAGMYSKTFPAAPGSVSVAVKRSGAAVTSVTSPVTVRTTTVADDYQYFRFSSLRGTAGQFDPLTQYA